MKPLKDRVAVELKETEGIITTSVKNEGIVKAIGGDVTEVKVGDHVYFDDPDRYEINDLVFIKEDEIIAKDGK